MNPLSSPIRAEVVCSHSKQSPELGVSIFLSFYANLQPVFYNRPLWTKLILCKWGRNECRGWELHNWDGPRLPAEWINCVLACGARRSNSRRGLGEGLYRLGTAWSCAGVSDLVIRLWGRAAQQKSPLNSEEPLKARSSPHQRRMKKNWCFFLFAATDSTGE